MIGLCLGGIAGFLQAVAGTLHFGQVGRHFRQDGPFHRCTPGQIICEIRSGDAVHYTTYYTMRVASNQRL